MEICYKLFLKFAFILSLVSFLFLENLFSQGEIIDEVYYFINDDIITKLDFETQKKLIKKSNLDISSKKNLNVLIMSNLIFNNLMVDSLKKKNQLVSDEVVEDEIKKIMNRQGIATLEQFKIALVQNDLDYDSYFDNIKKSLNQKAFLSSGIAQVVPSAQEIENYYQANKNKYTIKKPILDLSVIRIAVLDSISFSARRKFQKQLGEIKNKIEQEKISFDQAIDEFNDFKNNLNARKLGLLEIEELQLSQEDANKLLNLEKGQVSPILFNPEGLNIFLVNDKTTSGALPYYLARKRAEREYILIKRKEVINKKISDLFKKAYLKNNNSAFDSLAKIIDNKL